MTRALVVAVATGLAATTIAIALAADPPPAAAGRIRDQLIATPVTPDLGGGTTRVVASQKAFTLLADNAPPERERAFQFGNRLFNTIWAAYPDPDQAFDGLGPTFNRDSCSGCHVGNGRGRPPERRGAPMDSMLVRLSVSEPDGRPTAHPAYGDQLNDRAIRGATPEGRAVVDYDEIAGTYGDGVPFTLVKPRLTFADLAHGPLDQALVSPRVAPAVIGLGLLESVPAATLEALADPDDREGNGISGRINRLIGRDSAPVIGRFGWKASVATIAEQSAAAALGDIGLTTNLFPDQNCPAVAEDCRAAAAEGGPEISDSFFERLVTYMRTLAVPRARPTDDASFQAGLGAFRAFGCADCHVPTLRTGAGAPLAELRNQVFHPFTDLLVHDMGEGLADHRPDGSAGGTEWRTAPLWGIGLIGEVNGHDRLLHDGRARGLAEAILWHGGEAAGAREAFRKAPAEARDRLVGFLNAL